MTLWTEKPPVELYAGLLLHVCGAGGVGAGGQRGRGVETRGQAQRAPPHVWDHAHSRAARCTRVLLSNRHARNVQCLTISYNQTIEGLYSASTAIFY